MSNEKQKSVFVPYYGLIDLETLFEIAGYSSLIRALPPVSVSEDKWEVIVKKKGVTDGAELKVHFHKRIFPEIGQTFWSTTRWPGLTL